jgi:UDP-N-acetylglucosamine transferase subunit ALG13
VIFLTVGTQLPFTRLVSMVDEIAGEFSLDVFAQTAEPKATYSHIQHAAFLTPDDYDDILSRTRILVGHAGIGTILTAIRAEKPVIIVPRKASLGEHRNEHQRATARYLTGHEGVYVAETRDDLATVLQRADLKPASFVDTPEKVRLIGFLRDYVYAI